ncbi:TIGR04076 family protein [Pyrobaculum sp.]|uniref:TIGR04076 family protein n=1 Tax=Pyrobaculum sp. TaxID=2004705 RepID=UPI00319E82CC
MRIHVKEVRGYCALGYKPGNEFFIENYYIPQNQQRICLHAFCSMMSILTPFLKGISA